MPLSGRRKRERKSNKLKKRRAGRNSCSAFAWGTEEYFRPRCGIDSPTTARIGACRPMGSRRLRCPKVSKGRAESPLVRPLAHTPCPGWGLTHRLRRGSRACCPMGSRQLRCPKVSKGERREAGIQWIQPPKAVSDPEFRQTTSGAHGSANRADCLPRGKPFGAPAGAGLLPMGTDAPTAARKQGLQPYGALYCFGRRTEGFQRGT